MLVIDPCSKGIHPNYIIARVRQFIGVFLSSEATLSPLRPYLLGQKMIREMRHSKVVGYGFSIRHVNIQLSFEKGKLFITVYTKREGRILPGCSMTFRVTKVSKMYSLYKLCLSHVGQGLSDLDSVKHLKVPLSVKSDLASMIHNNYL